MRSVESTDSQPSGSTLRRVRLLIDKGARRRPAVVPVVLWAVSERAAMAKAMRIGPRFYGKRFLGAVTPRFLWVPNR